MTIYVAYHYSCPDGIFGCLATYLYFESNVVYLPHSTYSELMLPETNKEDILYLIDYSGNNSFILNNAHKFSKIILLDHHKTALEMIENYKINGLLPTNLEIVFDINKSGAVIAWDYFSSKKELIKNSIIKDKVLINFNYIQDNDLWKHVLPYSKEFSIGLGDLNLEYDVNKNPNIFKILLNLETNDLIERGKIISHENNIKIENDLRESFTVEISNGEHNVNFLAVFSTHANLRSELGNRLANKSQKEGKLGIGAVCYYHDDNDKSKIKVSLRSLKDFDTTKISQNYGGGGHKCASSFIIDSTIFESFKR